jgi:transcriptional regulator with XRE-family HTH domain
VSKPKSIETPLHLVPGVDLPPLPQKVGPRIRELRKRRGWSLERLGAESGIPQSTLSKFETDNLSMPVDRLFALAGALDVSVTELFDPEANAQKKFAAGRRSITRANTGYRSENRTYQYQWLFHDLQQKHMFPVIQTIVPRTMEEFGELLRHDGEEMSIVLKGRVQVITDIYEPTILEEMDSIYLDSRMGHAFLNAGEGETVVLNVSMSIVGDASDDA